MVPGWASRLGAVPLLGDLFDAGWKANRRNRLLLDSWLQTPARTARSNTAMLGLVLAAVVAVGAALVWLGFTAVELLVGQ